MAGAGAEARLDASPSWLTGALTYEKAVAAGGTPAIEQLALADLIERGELDRHLRRMRLRYRERRHAVVDALADRLPGTRVSGAAAGLYVLAVLPAGVDESAVVSAAAARRVGVTGVQGVEPGLVMGFANLTVPSIRRGVALLAEAVDACMP